MTPGTAPEGAESQRVKLLEIAASSADALIREILEALCRRDGLPLESSVVPGEPARNYDLAMRLGIGAVFGIRDAKAPAVLPPPVAACFDREALGRIVHETRCAENAKKDRPFVLEPWDRRAPSQQELDMKIAEAAAAAVRERSDEEGPDRG